MHHPKISIITPSFNQGKYLGKTIDSVINQGYPNLEYIIMDGGSSDNSVDIIKKHKNSINYWESKSDRGQSHAINKGLDIATGDVVGWINSDDYLLPRSLFHISERYQISKSKDAFWCIGNAFELFNDRNLITYPRKKTPTIESLPWNHSVCQPAAFWSSKLDVRVDENCHYTMDVDLWCRLALITNAELLEEFVAVSRVYDETKSSTGKIKMAREFYQLSKRYGDSKLRSFLYYYFLYLPDYYGASKQWSIRSMPLKIWRQIGRSFVCTFCDQNSDKNYSWSLYK